MTKSKTQEIDEYKLKLILSALRNVLEQNNNNGVNDYLIKLIEKEL